jgi:phosphoenolpyruvate-protein kinase (PTS system EI component)
MSTLKITQQQFEVIKLYEETRNTDIFLTENAKDLALTIALLSGIKLTGQNEHKVNKLIKDKKNMMMVKNTLEDDDKIQELVDALTEKGMKNPEKALSNNAEKIMKKFNEISDTENLGLKLDFLVKNNLKNLVD